MRNQFLFFLSLFCVQLANIEASKAKQIDLNWESLAFRIEDTSSFVGLVPVYLTVSELKSEDGYHVGTYTINVPLMTSKNDQGKIELPLKASIEELGDNGGVLTGKAYSAKDKSKINKIVCEVIPKKKQMIKLAITTSDRTIKFKSHYTVIEAAVDLERDV